MEGSSALNNRIAKIERNTNETQVKVKVNLDGIGRSLIKTGVGFFDHMLNLVAFHGEIDLEVEASGDLEVCDHHLVEDVGIALGCCFFKALGDKKGINRYGNSFLPMDECLAQVALDISGRSFLVFDCKFTRESIGGFSTEMVKEFFRAFAFNCGITLHARILYGENDHHKAEALFKALGKAIKEAKEITSNRLVSTKGIL